MKILVSYSNKTDLPQSEPNEYCHHFGSHYLAAFGNHRSHSSLVHRWKRSTSVRLFREAQVDLEGHGRQQVLDGRLLLVVREHLASLVAQSRL